MDICSRQSFPGQFSMVFSWIWFKNFQPRDETSQSDAVKLGLWALPEQRLFTLVEGHRREEFGHFKALFFFTFDTSEEPDELQEVGKAPTQHPGDGTTTPKLRQVFPHSVPGAEGRKYSSLPIIFCHPFLFRVAVFMQGMLIFVFTWLLLEKELPA